MTNDKISNYFRAITDCTYVLHIASPCEVTASDAIVQIAVCGTLNVLRGASKRQCVRKIVLTSSSGTINFTFTINFNNY